MLLIAGEITPTIEGLRITGGDVGGLGGHLFEAETADVGGGVYVISATVTIMNNWVFGNIGHDFGGGLCLRSSNATFTGNTVSGNTARDSGGMKVAFSSATISGNTFSANSASFVAGGLGLYQSDGTISGNLFSANTAATASGGVDLTECDDVMLSSNTIIDNTSDWGGGLQLYDSEATLVSNIIVDNRADRSGNGLSVDGDVPAVAVSGRLVHNTIARNRGGDGSGVYVAGSKSIELVNTVLVGHSVGIYVAAGSTADLEATLWGSGAWANTTDRSGPGTITHSGDRTGDPAFVDPDAGDYHIGPGSAAIDAGVDAGVSTDIDGEPRPTGTGYDIGADEFPAALSVAKQANPDPVQPGAQLTYTIHITNTGSVDLHATITDILPFSVTLYEASGGTLALPGGTLVPPDGTVRLPNGAVAVTWRAVDIAPGGVWMGTLVVIVEEDHRGPLTNLVTVTTEEGATGEARVTVSAGSIIYLPLVMRNSP